MNAETVPKNIIPLLYQKYIPMIDVMIKAMTI